MEETEKVLVGSYVYSRTMLLFRVRHESLHGQVDQIPHTRHEKG